MTKEALQTLVSELPEEFMLDSFISKLVAIDKAEKRNLEPVEGKVKNHEEVLDYWSKKFKDKGI